MSPAFDDESRVITAEYDPAPPPEFRGVFQPGDEEELAYRVAEASLEECMPESVLEFERSERIAAGVEHVCAGCGCSETRACPGGCIWATETLCSRCAR